MGRELRRVPANWEHPRNDKGHLQPLFDTDFATVAREWLDNAILWDKGQHPDQLDPSMTSATECPFYWQWDSSPPDPDYYRPAWTEAERTHFQIYETVTEGTPISPVFATRAQVAVWLIEQGYSEHAAEEFAKHGYAPSMVMTGGRIYANIHSLDAP